MTDPTASRAHRRRNTAAGVAIGAALVLIGSSLWEAQRQAAPSSAADAPFGPEQATASGRDPHGTQASARHIAPGATAATPLPPPGTPLKDVYDELKARADAGDAGAASRLFADLSGCNSARAKIAAQPVLLEHALGEDLSKLSESDLRERESFLGAMSGQIEKARNAEAVCAGLSDDQQQITPVALRAAQLGDAVAANCYVGGFPLLGKGLLAHPEWVTQYRDNALSIAQAIVAQGDWSMVAQLREAYAESARDAFDALGELTGADPVQAYRYLRLERLGASERTAAQIDRDLAAAERRLAPADVAAAATWAQETYARSFAAHPERKAMREPNICPE